MAWNPTSHTPSLPLLSRRKEWSGGGEGGGGGGGKKEELIDYSSLLSGFCYWRRKGRRKIEEGETTNIHHLQRLARFQECLRG